MARRDKQLLAYKLLRQYATSQKSFTISDVVKAIGWKPRTVDTYIRKQWKDFLVSPDAATYRVLPEFERMTQVEFFTLVTQKRAVFSKHKRVQFEEVVTYEFLLPLTKETELRASLDNLFYTDTIRQRLREIGLPKVSKWIGRNKGESDDVYISRVCKIVGETFGGYSISHVAGRFRNGPLTDRTGAADLLKQGDRYLIDETTAVVRFIIPVQASEALARSDELPLSPAPKAVAEEVKRIQALFFDLFVEAVARTVDEEEIWLVEEALGKRSLHKWKRSKPKE